MKGFATGPTPRLQDTLMLCVKGSAYMHDHGT